MALRMSGSYGASALAYGRSSRSASLALLTIPSWSLCPFTCSTPQGVAMGRHLCRPFARTSPRTGYTTPTQTGRSRGRPDGRRSYMLRRTGPLTCSRLDRARRHGLRAPCASGPCRAGGLGASPDNLEPCVRGGAHLGSISEGHVPGASESVVLWVLPPHPLHRVRSGATGEGDDHPRLEVLGGDLGGGCGAVHVSI